MQQRSSSEVIVAPQKDYMGIHIISSRNMRKHYLGLFRFYIDPLGHY
jgi:hypothetical protein